MTAPKWESGKLYLPGDIVQPITAPAPTAAQVVNGSFQSGGTGWDFTGLATYSSTQGYVGPGTVRIPGGGPSGSDDGGGLALNHTHLSVDPGGTLTARCMIRQGASDVDHTRGWVEIHWFNSADALVLSEAGNIVNDGRNGAWLPSSVSSKRPVGAAYARAGIYLWQGSGDAIDGDYLTVSGAQSGLPEGLVYKAVQPAAGMSGESEPAWPSVLGVQVTDNEVIWEAVATNRVTWTASPRYVSGATEPDWPTQPGGFVVDGTVQWEAVSRRVEDENCPNSKVVAIVASKVFAADRDIVRFSATANPLDWTSEQDAGYLPTGLQQANANDMAVLNQYRGNLVAFNASSFQNWQADPDPAAMAILDQMDGIGSTWQGAAQPVGNELFYLSQLGVRTIGIANAAENLAAGDVGMPIDPLVRDALRVAEANGSDTLATYYPGAGQYWLAFPHYPPPALSISGDLPDGYVGDSGTYQYTVSGGVLPYGDFTITAGSLPPGATMDAAGLVTYDYTTEGSYTWTVQGVDANGSPATLVDAAEVLPVLWFAVSQDGPVTAEGQASDDGAVWMSPMDPNLGGSGVFSGAGALVVVTNNGGRTSFDNGETWTSHVGDATTVLVRGDYADGVYYIGSNGGAVNGDTQQSRRSTDAINYTRMTLPSNLRQISKFIALNGTTYGFGTASAGGNCAKTADGGLTWGGMATCFSSNVNANSAATDGTKIVAVGNSNLIGQTADGVTWVPVTSPFAGTGAIKWIEYGDGRWVMVSASGEIASSPTADTGSWTIAAYILPTAPNEIEYSHGRWIIVGQGGRMTTSTDGLAWTSLANSFGATANIRGITAHTT